MNRRSFLASAADCLASPAFGYDTARRPNLLYILIDQLSGLALPGFDPNARMPHTRGLMGSGVVFSHACTAAMTCGPSRASLDTGLFSQAHGVGAGPRTPSTLPSLPATLAAHGYALSHPDGYSLEGERAMHERWLAELGYPQPLSSLNGSESLASYLDLPLKWKCGRAGLAPEHGFDMFCAQRAIRFLEANRTRPFACFLQLRGPHDPYLTPRPFDTVVDHERLALPPFRAGEFQNKPARQQASFQSQGAAKMSDEQIRRILALYYGMCAYSDQCVGQVLARLKELELDDRTVVVLVADHGDTMGRHRMMSKDFGFYEPAMRVPMVIRAPGRRGGVMNADPVSGVDLFPTLCDLMELPKPARLHGQSLVARWEGKVKDPWRAIFSVQGVPGKNRAMMVRTTGFKYARYDDGGAELYDLARDPDELENRVDDPNYREMVAELARRLADWDKSCSQG